MEYWEFLLQREGDRSWQPIRSKTQIEAGRYRVVVHSSRTNTDVEICITHQSTEEIPPKRRSQKRSRRTNPEGLMVVIPFTYLRPGLWELRCCGDIMSDFLGLSWQHSIQLNVLPKVTEVVLSEPISPLLAPAETEIEADLSEKSPSTSDQERHKADSTEYKERVSAELPVCIKATDVEATPTETEVLEPTPLVAREAVESNGDLHVEMRDEESAALSSPPDSTFEATPLAQQEVVQLDAIASSEQTPELESQTVEATPLAQHDGVQLDAIASSKQNSELQRQTVGESHSIESHLETIPSPLDSLTEVPTLDIDEAQAQAALLVDQAMSQELAEPVEQENTLTERSPQVAASTNPILDQSLQMLEQILQQVLEPVMQEFERSEPSEPQVVVESEESFESAINQQGLILTLEDESLGARRGEPLIVAGQVDVLDVHQLNGGETSKHLQTAFQGMLRYELRDPQNSRILLDVEQPLPKQALPIAFSHTLEIPPDCKTRLILGKVTLYDGRGRLSDATPVALASQPFTVTADLEELLGAIIPGTQAMPVAKVMILTNNFVSAPETQEETPEVSIPSVQQPVLDLVDVTQSRPPLSLKPSSGNPLPPQIYQPTTTSKRRKSLQLPTLPKLRSITESVESPVEQTSLPVVVSSAVVTSSPLVPLNEQQKVEVKQEDAVEQLPALADGDSAVVGTLGASEFSPTKAESLSLDTPEDTALESQLQEAMQQLEETLSQLQSPDSLASTASASDVSDSPVPLVESPDGTVPLGDGSGSDSEGLAALRASTLLQTADYELVNGNSLFDVPKTPEFPEFTTESPLEQSQETDVWESPTTTRDSSLNDLDTPEIKMQAAEVPPVAEPVADSLSKAALDNSTAARLGSSEIGLAQEYNDRDRTGTKLSELANSAQQSEDSLEPEPAAVDNAFQSLNLQDRFWLRLNSLATDGELSRSLNPDVSPPSNLVENRNSAGNQEDEAIAKPSESHLLRIDVEEVTQPLTSNTLLTDFDASMWAEEKDDFDSAIADTDTEQLQPPPFQPPPIEESPSPEAAVLDESDLIDIGEIDWAAQEFVVDEDDEEPSVPQKPMVTPEASQKVSPAAEPSQPQPQPQPQVRPHLQREIISPRQLNLSIPAPELSIPTKELAAGEVVTLRVKLPPHPARLCVKLWVQDRQSRSLLDGPRWLMDLIPDRKGEQEALTQLTVPFGSVEIRFEAIALDIDSQRESHKVALDCVVVPPDLPDFSLDEFEE